MKKLAVFILFAWLAVVWALLPAMVTADEEGSVPERVAVLEAQVSVLGSRLREASNELDCLEFRVRRLERRILPRSTILGPRIVALCVTEV